MCDLQHNGISYLFYVLPIAGTSTNFNFNYNTLTLIIP
jgi:hypothetical protein